jgi:hypothetical protein
VRLPPNVKSQTSSGYDNGLIIFANETFEDVSAVEYLGLDLYLNSDNLSPSEYVYVVPERRVPVPAGQLSYMGLNLRLFSRKQGYGDEASKTCASSGDSREVCDNKATIEKMGSMCPNCIPTRYASYYELENKIEEYSYYGCDASCFVYMSEDHPATINECPYLCYTNTSAITLNQQVPQSSWYKSFFSGRIDSNTSALTNVFVGYTSFGKHGSDVETNTNLARNMSRS